MSKRVLWFSPRPADGASVDRPDRRRAARGRLSVGQRPGLARRAGGLDASGAPAVVSGRRHAAAFALSWRGGEGAGAGIAAVHSPDAGGGRGAGRGFRPGPGGWTGAVFPPSGSTRRLGASWTVPTRARRCSAFSTGCTAVWPVPQFAGRQIVGWIGVVLLVAAVSGMWLWWPRREVGLAALGWRRGLKVSANIHHVGGVWIALPLIVVTVTGIYISFPQTSRAVVGTFPTMPPPQQRTPLRAAGSRNRRGAPMRSPPTCWGRCPAGVLPCCRYRRKAVRTGRCRCGSSPAHGVGAVLGGGCDRRGSVGPMVRERGRRSFPADASYSRCPGYGAGMGNPGVPDSARAAGGLRRDGSDDVASASRQPKAAGDAAGGGPGGLQASL